jgi:N6-L-threonylcarbamoyladenine synthase
MIAALGAAVVRRGLPPSGLDLPVDSSMPLTQVTA